jgi:hypothetical protein
MLNAFCRVAPSVRFNFLAILAAGVFLRAMVFSSRTSVEVHARRFFDFLGINPPYQIGSWYPLAGAEEIGTDRFSIMSSWSIMAADTAGKVRKGVVRSFLAIYRLGSNCNFQTVPPRFFDGSRPYYASSSGSASIASTKKTAVGARSRMDERRSRDFDLSSHVCLMARNRTACRRPTPRFYTEVAHYLEAIQPAGSNDADTVVGQLCKMKINDFMTKSVWLREHGRVMRDVYLEEVKSPAESK